MAQRRVWFLNPVPTAAAEEASQHLEVHTADEFRDRSIFRTVLFGFLMVSSETRTSKSIA